MEEVQYHGPFSEAIKLHTNPAQIFPTNTMSGTPFITFLGPSDLSEYDRKKRPDEQLSTVPKAFIDAMEVRQQVFVIEQGVPLANEFDSDDARACHWVSQTSDQGRYED